MARPPKKTTTIVWNHTGFHVIGFLLQGSRFNTHYDVSAILQLLADWFVGEVAASDRRLIVSADNARAHTAKVSFLLLIHCCHPKKDLRLQKLFRLPM
jgi:hypothetical protein